MTLNELQRLAEEAGAGIEEDWLSPYDLMRAPLTHEEDALYIAAMSPDTAKKLIAAAQVVEEAHRLIQEFKARWMALPPFADKINRATREGMTMAHMPIMQAEERLRTALEELK